MPHAVARLRAERVARSRRPFLARGSGSARCPHCRVPATFCLCALRPTVPTRAGMCLLMHDAEPMKPTNTGWLVADVVADTEAFGWARTHADPRLVALLRDPQRMPYVVFPADGAAPERVVHEVETPPGRRPLFVLLDGTWAAARRMFRASPYLDSLPVLSFAPAQVSRYRLRRARREGQLCTAEVAALCLRLAGEAQAARALDDWLDAFVARTEEARRGGAASAKLNAEP
jgi:DTW domain-containing protein YfiP